jgi:hypothetical protein
VQVSFAGKPTMATHVGDKLITAAVSPEMLAESGKYYITLKKSSTGATGEIFPVGIFEVEPSHMTQMIRRRTCIYLSPNITATQILRVAPVRFPTVCMAGILNPI